MVEPGMYCRDNQNASRRRQYEVEPGAGLYGMIPTVRVGGAGELVPKCRDHGRDGFPDDHGQGRDGREPASADCLRTGGVTNEEGLSEDHRCAVCEQPSGQLHRPGRVQRYASGDM